MALGLPPRGLIEMVPTICSYLNLKNNRQLIKMNDREYRHKCRSKSAAFYLPVFGQFNSINHSLIEEVHFLKQPIQEFQSFLFNYFKNVFLHPKRQYFNFPRPQLLIRIQGLGNQHQDRSMVFYFHHDFEHFMCVIAVKFGWSPEFIVDRQNFCPVLFEFSFFDLAFR